MFLVYRVVRAIDVYLCPFFLSSDLRYRSNCAVSCSLVFLAPAISQDPKSWGIELGSRVIFARLVLVINATLVSLAISIFN